MGRFSDAIGDCKAAIVNDPEVRKSIPDSPCFFSSIA